MDTFINGGVGAHGGIMEESVVRRLPHIAIPGTGIDVFQSLGSVDKNAIWRITDNGTCVR